MTELNKIAEQAELVARMEFEGYRIIPLSDLGYVVVDLACPPCFSLCSSYDELLLYCAEKLDGTADCCGSSSQLT